MDLMFSWIFSLDARNNNDVERVILVYKGGIVFEGYLFATKTIRIFSSGSYVTGFTSEILHILLRMWPQS